MNDSNQYMVQVGGDFEQNTYIIQDANGVPVQYEGNTIIQGELSDGNNLLNEPRWIQQNSGRGGKILGNQNYLNGDMVSVNGTGLNLNTRFTPSSIVLNSSSAGAQFDQDNMRLTAAVTGAGGRGRPRGRKPSRGNFPVVPIDMVRQLGIEQQVILQPTVPVAMKNKTTMCKPLLMSKKTQCNENDITGIGMSNSSTETTIKYIHTPVFIPVPVPVYIPVPTFIRLKAAKVDIDVNVNAIECTPTPSKDESEVVVTPTDMNISDCKLIDPIQMLNISEEPLTIVAEETECTDDNATDSKKRPSSDDEVSAAKHRKVDTTAPVDRKEPDSCKLKYSYGINAWRHWSKSLDLLKFSVTEINDHLVEFVQKIRKPNNEVYVPDSILYLCLGIQLFLYEHKYELNLFVDPRMESFQLELDKILATFKPKLSEHQVLVCRIEEEHLWESQQFGVSSPGVLVFSVCYLLTKQLKLRTALDHSDLRRSELEVTDRAIVYRSRASVGEVCVVCERSEDVTRCFYTIVCAYLDKCDTMSAGGDDDSECLYWRPLERAGDTDHAEEDALRRWYESVPMDAVQLDMMLNRIRIVKEVQESLLSSAL